MVPPRRLEMKDLTRDRRVDVCRAYYEATETRMQSIATENPLEEVHGVRRTFPRLHTKKIYDGDRTHKPNRNTNARDTCTFCGQQHEMKKELWPAWGRVGSGCWCRNHFAVCCKTGKRRVHALCVEQSDSEATAFRQNAHWPWPSETSAWLWCICTSHLARHVPDAEMTPFTKILQMWDIVPRMWSA